jgi:hypothetical protein
MKKLIVLLLSFTLLLSTFSVSFASSAALTDISPYLTLDEALKTIETNNSEIKLLDQKIDIYEKQYDDSLNRADAIHSDKDRYKNNNLSYIKDEFLTYKRKQLDLENLKHDRDTKLKELKVNIKDQYFAIDILQKNISNLQVQIVNLDKNIAQTKIKLQLGKIKNLDIKPLESQRNQ